MDDGGTVIVTASHDGYERLPGRPRHRRTWQVTDQEVVVVDEVEGEGSHRSTARLILAPGATPESRGDGRSGSARPTSPFEHGATLVRTVEVAERFGELRPTTSLELSALGPLPHLLVTRIVVEVASEEPFVGVSVRHPDVDAARTRKGSGATRAIRATRRVANEQPAAMRSQYGGRRSASMGKCLTLHVSSRAPLRMAVAAMARSAPSMV